MLETGGHISIRNVDNRVKIVMDLKCPSSEMADKNLYDNIEHLKSSDEVKFVIGDTEDYEWAKEIFKKYNLSEKHAVLFSLVFGQMETQKLAELILKDKLNVRMQLQMHKYIWEPNKRGV